MMNQVYYQLRYAIPLWFVQLLTNWLPENRITIRLRGSLVAPFLGKCGRNLQLARGITFLNSSGIHVGNDVYISTGCWIDGIGQLIIDSEVKISPYVVITTSSHCFKNNSVFQGGSHAAAVRIGAGCWIASHAVLAAGVTIDSGTIVAANAVVTRDLPENVFAAGVPARIIGARRDKEPNIFARFDSSKENNKS